VLTTAEKHAMKQQQKQLRLNSMRLPQTQNKDHVEESKKGVTFDLESNKFHFWIEPTGYATRDIHSGIRKTVKKVKTTSTPKENMTKITQSLKRFAEEMNERDRRKQERDEQIEQSKEFMKGLERESALAQQQMFANIAKQNTAALQKFEQMIVLQIDQLQQYYYQQTQMKNQQPSQDIHTIAHQQFLQTPTKSDNKPIPDPITFHPPLSESIMNVDATIKENDIDTVSINSNTLQDAIINEKNNDTGHINSNSNTLQDTMTNEKDKDTGQINSSTLQDTTTNEKDNDTGQINSNSSTLHDTTINEKDNDTGQINGNSNTLQDTTNSNTLHGTTTNENDLDTGQINSNTLHDTTTNENDFDTGQINSSTLEKRKADEALSLPTKEPDVVPNKKYKETISKGRNAIKKPEIDPIQALSLPVQESDKKKKRKKSTKEPEPDKKKKHKKKE
jgi:hypothetical protein